jgi:F0F1-type ATP synthase assembly protein I
MNTGRLVGIILIVVGFGIAVIAGLWLALQTSAGSLSAGGAVVGAGLAFIPVALLVGFGIFMFVRGSQEAEEESSMHQQRELLDIVKSRGQVAVADLALEMHANVDTVKSLVHQLVGLQVFSGYVNWEKGIIYSSEASKLRELDKCKNCGGEIKLVGKGVVTCKFCGTEYFLT